jgi:hypothetical protein
MTILETILEVFEEEKFEAVPGFDEAVIGVDDKSMRLIYSVTKCYKVLSKDMTLEDAKQYFDFNIYGAYLGEKMPIFCWDTFITFDDTDA